MRAVLIPLLALPVLFTVPTHAAGEGLYKLEALSGSGSRSWQLTALLDGIPCSDHGNITLTDTMTGPGELILKADGTAEAKWKHRVTLTYDYQPDYYQPRPWVPLNGTETCPLHTENAWLDQNYYPYIGGDAPPRPRNKLVVEFDTQATGTWGGAVTLNLTCTSTCNVTASYKPENSTQLTVENFMATLNNVNVTATASGGAMTFEVDMLKTFVQALANQHLTGDRYLSAEDSLRNGKDRVVPNYSPCDGFPGGSGDEFVDKVVKTWTYKGTQLSFSPTSGNMDAKYTQYYLLNVNAPFGFYAQGNYGTASGLQEARFRYGSSTFQTSIESGYAEASSFDYGDAATAIDVDILSDGAVALTLNKPLIKVPVSPWAAPAGAWNASAGVRYRRSPLHWPISMSATRSLASASILTGLWGISGSAASTFDVSAHSQGTPQKGNLTANIQFKVAKKQLGFSLSGKHQTTLNGSGLTATGRFSSSPLGAKWQQRASLLSLVPGANAALSALGPFGARLVGGAGVSVEAGVKGTLSGEYQATPGDATPLFTSGTLTADAYLKAQVNPVPQFARGIVNLDISGGGGAIMVIDLAPSPSVSSLTGYLNFMLTARLFNLETDVDKQWNFGDPPPPAPMFAQEGASFGPSALSTPGVNEIPAQVMADVAYGPVTADDPFVLYSEPHPTLPAPATQVVARYQDPFGTWQSRTTAQSNGKANFAPVYARPSSTPSIGTFTNFFRGVVVWVQATGPAPVQTSDLPAYMDSTELRFQYYNGSNDTFEGGERELTSNSTADFGPSLVNCTATTDVRLFWVRSSGMDLTGSTTPMQLMTRNWTTYHPGAPVNDPSTAWSPEATAVSGLPHIVDWRATAWDNQTAAVALVADMDGDLSTLDDTEIWLARETAGVWAAPVRLTTNSVADEAPTLLFKNASTLVIGWRQGDEVVGTFDLDAAPTPAIWFDPASGVAEEWQGAQLGYRTSENSLFVIWSRDTGLAFTEQAYGPPASGSAWPQIRFHDFGSGVVSGFATKFYLDIDPDQEKCHFTAVLENSTDADLNTVPTHLNACIETGTLSFGAPARTTQVADTFVSKANPVPGDDLRLAVRVESPNAISYSWSRNGEPLDHFTGPEIQLFDLEAADEGIYTVTISDGTGTIEQSFTVTLPMTYATWIARFAPGGGPGTLPDDDLDLDGCKNVLEYLFDTDPTDAGDCSSGELAASALPATGEMIFHINQRASDLEYVIEFTENFLTWTDVTTIFTTHPLGNGREVRHLFAPFSADSINSYENYGTFPLPVNSRGFYRIRLTSGP